MKYDDPLELWRGVPRRQTGGEVMVSSVKSVKGMRLAVVPLGYYGVSNKIEYL